MKIAINMPQAAANGLSENWLFKNSGDMHWHELCRSIGQKSAEIADDSGARLYPTFVAISLRSTHPLASVQENDELESDIELANFGRSFFHSTISMKRDDIAISLEMVTAFSMRAKDGKNDLRKSTPPASSVYRCSELQVAPDILNRAKRLRKGDLDGLYILDRQVQAHSAVDLSMSYEPSPYSDFNGANLLYFASYPTICDTVERLLIRKHDLATTSEDWCLSTSTKDRDIFYYRNLDIGDTLDVRINLFEDEGSSYFIASTILSGKDGLPIADVFTRKSKLSSL